ncbi:MAG TPA: hypothetical protein VEC17_00490 [Candidatus Binatia bacterium]|nr:hypothetical protein [Candidatus Binatia bacterium]
MKISNHLPHFRKNTLLITAGKQEACFYLSSNEHVRQTPGIKLKKPQFTDREGYFEQRGGGRTFGSGSVYESQDEETTRAFIKQLSDAAGTIVQENDVQSIYLFCPTYLANQIEKSMPRDMQVKIEYIFYGNYHHQHPFVLLAKIKEFMRVETSERKIEPIKDEAWKILNNS